MSLANGTKAAAASGWTPDSWRSKPIKQVPDLDPQAVAQAAAELGRLPPLVTPKEILKLKSELRSVARGEAFLLQGGDCAELFDYCEQTAIESKIKLLLQMSLVLILGCDKRVVRIGRMAGQYAKPRSSDTETLPDGRVVPSFRGDILNSHDIDDRTLDPRRLVRAYHYSAATLNYSRAAATSGIADLNRPMDWDLGHVQDPDLKTKYSEIVNALETSMRFMNTIGAVGNNNSSTSTVDLFTSHEGLVLEYEQPLTRPYSSAAINGGTRSGGPRRPSTAPLNGQQQQQQQHEGHGESVDYYDTSAHFLWIGDRTRQIDGAHVEFFRGIANPIGVKVGPTTPTADLLALLRTLNPSREVGKITLITRYGAGQVAGLLPAHIRAVEDSEYARCVVWQCDPMHGNTRSTASGVKTRRFGDIFAELRETLRIHREQGSYLGGVHLELTGDAVTECLGGSEELNEEDLQVRYTSLCDPRLNEKQALELAFEITHHYRNATE